jgi:hypothetical protein
VSDELFVSGTAAEFTPIRSVDRITVGSGGRGDVTAKIQKAFFEITKGERKAPGDWLTYVKGNQKSAGDNGYTARTIESAGVENEPVLSYQSAPVE